MSPLPPPPAPAGAIGFPPTAVRVCPECAGPLVRSSGCLSCTQCGWGRCG